MAQDMLFSGESKNIEYKVTVPDKSEKYMKTVVAFANGSGGRIVFGIDDKTLKVVGMDPEKIFKTMDAITNAISDGCEPRIRPEVTLQTIEDKTIIVVEILPGAMRPYYIKSKGMTEGTYVRVSGTTRPAEGYILKELILDGQNRYYDSEPCNGMPVTDTEIEKLCKSMKEIALKNTWQDSEKTKIKDVTKNTLISWGILAEENGKVLPTNAYALLTGTMRMQPVIQCGVFKGTDRAYFVDRREFEGSIQEPGLIDFDGDFRVNMYRKAKGEFGVNDKTTQTTQTHQSDTLKLSEEDKTILAVIHDKPTMTQKEYALELGWTVDRVKYYLRKMKIQQIINRVGSIHNGHWEVLIDENEWLR